MGEARRRKQLDPTWGKINREIDSENQVNQAVSRILSNPKTVCLNSIAYSLFEYAKPPNLRPIKLGQK
jgi:hypothetical protein